MKMPILTAYIVVVTLLFLPVTPAGAHNIYFCGEAIPTDRDFVANKLMNVIRRQMPAVSLSYLRYQSNRYFPAITAWLKRYGIPEDFKYIPIVECGFRNNLTSGAGAAGFWQLMPATARGHGLIVTPDFDQRNDPYLSTLVACKVILEHYAYLKSRLPSPSWVLTAAAYNFGPVNVLNAAKSGGHDYFNMTLNSETAEYVYRLIAVKELFERPELYMNGFGANIFSKENITPHTNDTGYAGLSYEQRGAALGSVDGADKRLEIKIAADDSAARPETITHFVPARIISPEKPFRDGSMMRFELLANLTIAERALNKGSKIEGKAWLIDDRVYVDFGFGSEIEIQDKYLKRGLSRKDAVTNREYVVLKTEVELQE